MFIIKRLKKQVLRVKKFDAGAASRYGYGSIKMMRLRLHNTGRNRPATPFRNVFIMLDISSKQEMSEPHRFTAPASPDDVARCGAIRLQLLHR
jgi:hypothetical protein